MKPVVPPLLRRMSSDEYEPLPLPRARRARPSRSGNGRSRSPLGRCSWRARHTRPTAAAPRRRCGRSTTRTAADSSTFPNAPCSRAKRPTKRSVVVHPSSTCKPISSIPRAGSARAPPRWAASCAWPIRIAGPVTSIPRIIDGAAWAALVFGASETAIALLTSTPGPAGTNVLTNLQIAAARDVVDRYAGAGRVLTHTIVHPNFGPHELDAMDEWRAQLDPSGWKVYTLYGPPTKGSPTGGWFLDDDEIGFPFLERVNALGPRVVAAHKGLGGPIPDKSVDAASPRDIGPGRRRVSRHQVRRVPLRLRTRPRRARGPVRCRAPESRRRPSDQESRARRHRRRARNVYAELGSTWFLMLRRPARSRARARQAALGARAGTHRVGYRLHVVRITATAHRRVPRVPDSGTVASRTRLSAAHRRGEGTHSQRERASRSTT